MNRKETCEVDRFNVRSDDGYETTVVIFQVFNLALGHRVAGLKSAQTVAGEFCNPHDDGTFELVDHGVILRRI